MSNEQFDTLRERVLKVNEVIKELDNEIKQPAFELFKMFITNAQGETMIGQSKSDAGSVGNTEINLDGLNDYYLQYKPEKPAEAAHVLAGWLYKNRGNVPFTLKDIEQLFDRIGEARPSRLDMTFKAASKNGKKMFQPVGRGSFKLTVYGENHFKMMFKES